MLSLHRRPLVRIAIFSLLLFQTACSQSPNKPMEDAVKSFAGNWKVVSLERSGEKSNADAVKDMVVTLEGDKFRFVEMTGPGRGTEEAKARDVHSEEYVFQVNPAKTGDIDFVYSAGEDRGKSRSGLYAFDGAMLKICLASVGGSRPTQIASGDDVTVFVLEPQALIATRQRSAL